MHNAEAEDGQHRRHHLLVMMRLCGDGRRSNGGRMGTHTVDCLCV